MYKSECKEQREEITDEKIFMHTCSGNNMLQSPFSFHFVNSAQKFYCQLYLKVRDKEKHSNVL